MTDGRSSATQAHALSGAGHAVALANGRQSFVSQTQERLVSITICFGSITRAVAWRLHTKREKFPPETGSDTSCDPLLARGVPRGFCEDAAIFAAA